MYRDFWVCFLILSHHLTLGQSTRFIQISPLTYITFTFVCVCCSCSATQSCPTLCDPMNPSMPGLPVHHQLLEFTQTHVHRVGDAIQPSHLLLSPSPPAFNHSQHQGLFKWVSSVHQVAKVSELQHQHQSFQYMTAGKTIALTIQTVFGRGMSLVFNMLSMFVIAFLPRSKHLLISWLQSPSAVILEPRKIKSASFHCFPIYLPWSDGAGWHHRLNGREFEWTPGAGDGQGGLACCDSQGHKELDMTVTELNWTETDQRFPLRQSGSASHFNLLFPRMHTVTM